MEPTTDVYPPLHYQEDFLLVQRCLQGDAQAAESLYNRAYYPALWTARKANQDALFSEADLQEIVHEALRRCLAKCGHYLPISRFSTWACGFVRFVALDARRKQYRTRKKESAFCRIAIVSYPDPEQHVIQREREYCFWLAFFSLSETEQHLIRWHTFEECTQTAARRMTGLRRTEMENRAKQAERHLHRRHMSIYYGTNPLTRLEKGRPLHTQGSFASA